jgi:hypothetical protein
MNGGHVASLEQRSGGEPDAPTDALYPLTACLLVSLLGGPFAAVAISGLNANRARRLQRDRTWFALATLLASGTLVGIAWLALYASARGRSDIRYGALLLAPVFSVALCASSWRRAQASPSVGHAARLEGAALWGRCALLVVVAQALQSLVNATATHLWR